MGFREIAAAIVVAALLPACGGVVNPSQNDVQTVSGTFEVGGVGPVHEFSASKNGEFFVTLISLAPDSTAIVAVSLGQRASGGCGLITSAPATVNRQALGGPLDKGDYCVQVSDAGLTVLSGPQTYSLRVSTP
ncbi:MAG: hypothetical protein GEU82_11720 [Luteitalea sp.]|nr:hypothetical protein [Luteitalea sp.]